MSPYSVALCQLAYVIKRYYCGQNYDRSQLDKTCEILVSAVKVSLG